jgi:hypothetical protein
MKSFKQYVFEGTWRQRTNSAAQQVSQFTNRTYTNAFKPRKRSQELAKQMDFENPAAQHSWNKSLPDKEKWPSKPLADWKAAQIRWSVSDGKKPKHLSKES